LIGCVAALNFSVYSSDKNAAYVSADFTTKVKTVRDAAATPGYENDFDKAVKKAETAIAGNKPGVKAFNGKSGRALVEWLITYDLSDEWKLSGGVAKTAKLQVAKTAGLDDQEIAKASSAYYDDFIRKNIDFELPKIDSKRIYVKADEVDYAAALAEVSKGELSHLSNLWSIYVDSNESGATSFKKVVGTVSALMATACANNNFKLDLNSIKNGMDVYKCLMHLGPKTVKNTPADKKDVTFEKLMGYLPEFIQSIKNSKLLDAKVVKKDEQQAGGKKNNPTKPSGINNVQQSKPAGGAPVVQMRRTAPVTDSKPQADAAKTAPVKTKRGRVRNMG
jgi:hypothetical protein